MAFLDTVGAALLGGITAKFSTSSRKDGVGNSNIHQSIDYQEQRLRVLNLYLDAVAGEGYLKVDELTDEHFKKFESALGVKGELKELVKQNVGSRTELDLGDEDVNRFVNLFRTQINRARILRDKVELYKSLRTSGKLHEMDDDLKVFVTPDDLELQAGEFLIEQTTNMRLPNNETAMQNFTQAGIAAINAHEFLRDALYTTEVTRIEVKDFATTSDKTAVISYLINIDPDIEKDLDKKFADIFKKDSRMYKDASPELRKEFDEALKSTEYKDKSYREILQIMGTEAVSGLVATYGHTVSYMNYLGPMHGETFATSQSKTVSKWITGIFEQEGTRYANAYENKTKDLLSGELPLVKGNAMVIDGENTSYRSLEFYQAKDYFTNPKVNQRAKELFGFEYDAYHDPEHKLTKRDVINLFTFEVVSNTNQNINNSREFTKTATKLSEFLQTLAASGEWRLPKSIAELPDSFQGTSVVTDRVMNSYLKGTQKNPMVYNSADEARFVGGAAEAVLGGKSDFFERAYADGRVIAINRLGAEKTPTPALTEKPKIIMTPGSTFEKEDPVIPVPKWRERLEFLQRVVRSVSNRPQHGDKAIAGLVGDTTSAAADKVKRIVAPGKKGLIGRAAARLDKAAYDATNTYQAGAQAPEPTITPDGTQETEQRIEQQRREAAERIRRQKGSRVAKLKALGYKALKVLVKAALPVAVVAFAAPHVPIEALEVVGLVAGAGAVTIGAAVVGKKTLDAIYDNKTAKIVGAVAGGGLAIMGIIKQGNEYTKSEVNELSPAAVTVFTKGDTRPMYNAPLTANWSETIRKGDTIMVDNKAFTINTDSATVYMPKGATEILEKDANGKFLGVKTESRNPSSIVVVESIKKMSISLGPVKIPIPHKHDVTIIPDTKDDRSWLNKTLKAEVPEEFKGLNK